MQTQAREALFCATVRVRDGAGVVVKSGRTSVIVTAYHVVSVGDPNRVWAGSTFSDCTVLAHDEKLDLAILTSPPELEKFGLEIAPSNAPLGEQIWASAFPSGWDGHDPILARGTVAGFGQTENWATIDGSWGLSGGPMCSIVDDRVLVAGVMLGRAGDTSARLAVNRRVLDSSRATIRALQTKADSLPPTNVTTQMLQLAIKTMEVQVRMFEETAHLLEEHFRTGFVRFASAKEMGTLLGPA